jgi:tellurite resistance-related uncharacterized protein
MTGVLPAGLKPYKRTASFTENSIPPGLLKDHATKDGTWGLIHVEEGNLRYVICDAQRVTSERILTPHTGPGIVEPAIVHFVAPIGRVKFHVEFLRSGDT